MNLVTRSVTKSVTKSFANEVYPVSLVFFNVILNKGISVNL
jgi:hypothetical protein